ncbi:MAG: ABC transporter ATP-binding protein [Candidatus Helarchaeota archaeon]|nr:ABC transporter ATP-binding protein [Candidatus Helarchaeota archaeon]
METIIELVNVTKTYVLGEVEVYALRKVNMKVYRGEILGIMGPSGSGKTTLLNLIGTLDTPDSGKIFIDGIDIGSIGERELVNLRRRTLGYIFQFYNLIPVLSALDNVNLPMLLAGVGKEKREKRSRELLELVGLKNRLFHKPDELSGGEQQRVAIARALANDPSIILADEPTGDLDEETGIEVVKQMRRLIEREKKTLIIVTHDPVIATHTTRILNLRDGHIIVNSGNP